MSLWVFGIIQYGIAIWGWASIYVLLPSWKCLMSRYKKKKLSVQHQGHILWVTGLVRTGANRQLVDFPQGKSYQKAIEINKNSKEMFTLFCFLLNTGWIQGMHEINIWHIDHKLDACLERWTTLRTTSEITTKGRPILYFYLGPLKSNLVSEHVKELQEFLLKHYWKVRWHCMTDLEEHFNFFGSYLQLRNKINVYRHTQYIVNIVYFF